MSPSPAAPVVAALLVIGVTASACTGKTEGLREASATTAHLRQSAVLWFDTDADEEALDATLDLLGRRLTAFGFAAIDLEPDADAGLVRVSTRADSYDLGSVIGLLAEPGHLHLRPVLRSLLAADPDAGGIIDRFTEAPTHRDELRPDEDAVLSQLDEDGEEIVRFHVGPEALTGAEVATAFPGRAETGWLVKATLTDERAVDRLNAVAADCAARASPCPTGQLAIALDDRVLSVPFVNRTPFSQGDVRVTGLWTEGEARALASVLEAGGDETELVELSTIPGE